MNNSLSQVYHNHLNNHMSLVTQCLEDLSQPLQAAVQLIWHSLINDGKILICGNQYACGLANLFAANLNSGLTHQSISLAALSLCSNDILLTHHFRQPEYCFSQQVEALGKQHDVLCVIATNGHEANLIEAVTTAQERHMPVLALTGHDGGEIACRLNSHDVLLNIPNSQTYHIAELQYIIINCLHQMIVGLTNGQYVISAG